MAKSQPCDNRYGGRTEFAKPEIVRDAKPASASRVREARKQHHGENAKPRKHYLTDGGVDGGVDGR